MMDDDDYEAEAKRLYHERIGLTQDEYELADIEAQMMLEAEDSDD